MKIVPHVSLVTVIEVIAILVGAFSGFVEARRKRMDIVGVIIVAFIAAFGGGTLRDILLDKRPLFWVQHQEYTILLFVLALAVAPFMKHLRHIVSERLIVIAPPRTLGELRKHYHKEVSDRITGELAKDLTGHPVPAIEKAIADA